MKNTLILTSSTLLASKNNFSSPKHTFSDVAIYLDTKNSPKIKVIVGTQNIKDFSCIYFRPWRKYQSIAVPIASYLLHEKIRFVDSEVGSTTVDTKAYEYVQCTIAGLPIPKTIIAQVKNIKRLSKNMSEIISYPLILKASDGARGSDNHLITSFSHMKKTLSEYPADKLFIIQEYIPNSYDYRFVVTGFKTACVYQRIRDPKSESHLNNVSKGATRKDIDPKSVKALCAMAEKASLLLKREICGVDIIIDSRTKEPYILEANAAPQLHYMPALTAVRKYLGELS